MTPHWQLSYDALDNSDDYLLVGDSNKDPLQILLARELEQEADNLGYASTEDYLYDHPELLIH